MNPDPIAIIQSIIDGTVDGGPPPYVEGMGLDGGVIFKSVEKGRFGLEWTAAIHHCQYDGIVQGGVIGVIADMGQSFAFWSTAEGPEAYSTVDLAIRFFRPIKAGDTMIVDSRLVNRSSRMGVIDTTFVHQDTNKLHATVSGGWMLAKRDFEQS